MSFVARVFFLLVVAAGAIGIGAYSAERVTRSFPGFVPIHAESWRGYPGLATRSADPYARANLARTGKLAIADTEGIEFTARRDAEGAALRSDCNYNVVGNVPANRLWTFRVEPVAAQLETALIPSTFMNSRLHARTRDVDVNLNVGPRPSGLNWLSVDNTSAEQLAFVITFYDSAVATTATFTDLDMPVIYPTGCADG
ncbi:MAG: DUF1214 domain-containing protein [Pseudomonadota bacterium]